MWEQEKWRKKWETGKEEEKRRWKTRVVWPRQGLWWLKKRKRRRGGPVKDARPLHIFPRSFHVTSLLALHSPPHQSAFSTPMWLKTPCDLRPPSHVSTFRRKPFKARRHAFQNIQLCRQTACVLSHTTLSRPYQSVGSILPSWIIRITCSVFRICEKRTFARQKVSA